MATSDVLTETAPATLTERATRARVQRGSIRRRVSLLIGLLIAVVGVISSWLAFREAENVLRASGHERITAAATQVGDLLAQSVSARALDMKRLAGDPSVQELAAATSFASLPRPPAILKPTTARNSQAIVWLYGADGRALARLLPLENDWIAPDSTDARVPAEGIGPLYVRDGRPGYRSTTAIRAPGAAPDAAPTGFLSIERPLGASPARGLIERLIGANAVIKLGNATGDVWTDLSAPTTAPPAREPGQSVRYTSADGAAHLGTAVKISGTPWLVWVEFPEAGLLQPARNLLARLMPLTVVVIILGSIAVYAVAARITTPLEQLARAADGLAAGDFTRRVETSRTDEIGQLGRAFNFMADRVAESHHVLEGRVQARTVELEQTMERLRETQAELMQRERLATLGQLASSVGHELRNPLGVMTNAVYYLKMIQTDPPAQVAEYLGILRHQIGLAEKIVGDLLDFARLKKPQVQSVDVPNLIAEQIGRLGSVANVSVKTECADVLPRIHVDPVHIGQIMLNLLTNAQQAMEPTGGTITVRARAAGPNVVIDVEDDGPGISAEIIEKIFEPLFTTKARGIGLGLAVSKSLAEANGGQLTVTSRLGKGATFSLALPATGGGRAS
ncbi:MAG TPA: ATP-binding protein [Vicinamibacterales bacterium]